MTKTTSPLVKFILTGEGILTYAVNIALIVAASLPDTLSWTHAGIFITITTALSLVSRTLLKIKALQTGLGAPAPPLVQPVDPAVIETAVKDILDPVIVEIENKLKTPVPA